MIREAPAPTLTATAPGRYALAGEVSFGTVAELHAREAPTPAAGRLTIDLAGMTRIDAAALAVLLDWRREAQRRGAVLELRSAPAPVVQLAQVCGVAPLLGLTDGAARP